MPRKIDKRVTLPSFGCVSALLNDRGISVEVHMAPSETTRILEAWREYELKKLKPQVDVISALENLIPKSRNLAPHLVAKVPVGRTRRIRITPEQ